jgi:hypothetical protein
MRGKLVHSFRWALTALALGACGQAEVGAVGEVPELGESAQAVLHPPPAPPSGDIVDSTAFLGPVSLGGSVQTQFTTHPQYFSFAFQVAAGAHVKLEVTHLGSSMYLDTGLFLYGPRQPNGSWGTTLVAVDDDSGYGQLSKIAGVALPQGGEYLAVVSTGTGAGKKFRLQLDCLNGQCAPPVDPALYDSCDLDVATRIEVCVQARVEEIDPVLGRRMTAAEAYAACTGADDAHAAFLDVCAPGSTTAWCSGGEQAFTQQMWPVCQSFYHYYYGLGPLVLGDHAQSSALAAAMAAGNTRCNTGENWCDGTLDTYTVPGVATVPPSLAQVALPAAYASLGELMDYHRFERWPNPESWTQFIQDHGSWWLELQQALPAELGSGAVPQVAHYYASYPVAPGAKDYHHAYVFYFPQTNRVAVLQHITHEI